MRVGIDRYAYFGGLRWNLIDLSSEAARGSGGRICDCAGIVRAATVAPEAPQACVVIASRISGRRCMMLLLPCGADERGYRNERIGSSATKVAGQWRSVTDAHPACPMIISIAAHPAPAG